MIRLNIPQSWTVVKLKDIAEINMGQSPKGTTVRKSSSSGIPLVGGAANIQDDTIITNKYTTVPTKLCKAGDFIYCVRATIGKLSIADKEYCLGRGVAGITPKSNSKYLKYYLKNIEDKLFKQATGSTFVQIDKKTLESISVPIPSEDEQKRVSQKIESCFEKIDLIEKNLNLTETLLEKYRESILNKAFHGKLIPQEPSDEPASVLLEKIHKTREQEQKRTKKKQEFVPIAKDEKPFDIPNSWIYAKIQDIFIINPKNQIEDKSLEVSFIPMSTVNQFTSKIESRIIKSWEKVRNGYTHFQNGDLIFAKITPCMENKKSAICENLKNGYGAGSTEFHVLRPSKGIPGKFILHFIRANFFLKEAIKNMTGTAGQKRIPKDWIAKQVVPVPPKNEQYRIIEKIESCFEQIDSISCNIKSQKKMLYKLKKSILQKAFQGRLVEQRVSEGTGHQLLKRILAGREKKSKKNIKNKD